MSNITERKKQITTYLSSGEMTNRLASLFENDDKKAEKFKATIINIALDKSLQSCTVQSILKSALDIAEIGLPLAKGLGQAYIVKYKRDAQPVIGYKGWLALHERGGKSVKAKPVFACDEFEMIDNGFDETIVLKPNLDERKEYDVKWVEENLRGVLVAIRDNNTGIVSNTWVSMGKIRQIAGKSPSRNSDYSPYLEWNLEMYMAKAIKYVTSKTPVGEAIAKAIEIDNRQDIERIADNKESLDLNAMIEASGERTQDDEDAIDTEIA